MSDRIKQITDLIDGALSDPGQHTPEQSYGTDFGDGKCWRCGGDADGESGSGLCDGCRAFLLEDSDVDPTEEDPARGDTLWGRFTYRFHPSAVPDTLFGLPSPPVDFPITGVEVETENGIEIQACNPADLDDGWMADRWQLRDQIGPYRVSTMFLGVNHGLYTPLWYETMVFGPDGAPSDQQRYPTRDAAIEGHAEMYARIRALDDSGFSRAVPGDLMSDAQLGALGFNARQLGVRGWDRSRRPGMWYRIADDPALDDAEAARSWALGGPQIRDLAAEAVARGAGGVLAIGGPLHRRMVAVPDGRTGFATVFPWGQDEWVDTEVPPIGVVIYHRAGVWRNRHGEVRVFRP